MITELLKVEEYVSYQSMYLDLVEDKPIVVSLEGSLHEFISFFNSIEEAKLSFSYEEGKWTVKELLLHVIDTERIFQYRALRFSRNDGTILSGFDENIYSILKACCIPMNDQLNDDEYDHDEQQKLIISAKKHSFINNNNTYIII